MTYESGNPAAITALGEGVVALLGRVGQLFDGPLGQHDGPRAEIEMMQHDVIAALNYPKSILTTPAGETMLLTLLHAKVVAARDVAFGSNETRC
jgi:hypothetical protein